MNLEKLLPSSKQEVEVLARPRRRTFSADYKLRILLEAQGCTKPGEIGALLRREGLYRAQLSGWRAARERGELSGLAGKKRGPRARKVDERDRRIAELERENRRLHKKLERAEALVDVQKKVSEILGIELPEPDEENEAS